MRAFLRVSDEKKGKSNSPPLKSRIARNPPQHSPYFKRVVKRGWRWGNSNLKEGEKVESFLRFFFLRIGLCLVVSK